MDVFLIILFFVVLAFVLGLVTAMALLSSRFGQRMAEVGLPPNHRLLSIAERLRRVGRGLSDRFTPPSERLLMLSHGHLISQYILTVVRTGIADAFEQEPRPAAAVAEQLKLHPGTVAHMLRVLASHGCFEVVEGTEHMFRHNSVSALLRGDHPQSLRAVMNVLSESFDTVARTPEMATSGTPSFVEATGGQPFWEAVFSAGGKPDGASVSGEALLRDAEAALFRLSEGGLLADYEWSEHGRIIDLSGGHARFLAAILKANRGVVGLVFDQPATLPATQAWWERFAETVSERVKFIPGETFDALPQMRAGDALLLGFVLSTMDDDAAVEGLLALRRRVGVLDVPLLVADLVLDDKETDRAKLAMDAQARGMGPIRHRTESAWRTLLLAGGFKVASVQHCRGYASIIQASPAEGVVFHEQHGEVAKSSASDEVQKETPKPLLTPNAA